MRLKAEQIKSIAKNLGFDACGISKAIISDKNKSTYQNWIDSGFNANMTYLSRNENLRNTPELLVENAKTVISLVLNYYTEDTLDNPNISISKYAYGNDYHYVIKHKLQQFIDSLNELNPEINARGFTDSAPIYERFFAVEAGLGFLGKNTCLITPDYGSWVFIAEIICDIESDYDKPVNTNCGSCSICIDSCPTGALSDKGLNANKCISYHTIESKDDIPENILAKMGTQVFGCDICQNVCPHNSKAKTNKHKELQLLPQIKTIELVKIENLSNSQFKKAFGSTSLFRAGKKKLISNFKAINKVRPV